MNHISFNVGTTDIAAPHAHDTHAVDEVYDGRFASLFGADSDCFSRCPASILRVSRSQEDQQIRLESCDESPART